MVILISDQDFYFAELAELDQQEAHIIQRSSDPMMRFGQEMLLIRGSSGVSNKDLEFCRSDGGGSGFGHWRGNRLSFRKVLASGRTRSTLEPLVDFLSCISRLAWILEDSPIWKFRLLVSRLLVAFFLGTTIQGPNPLL
ncbi:hypothetical protein PVK06_042276 [Gossypium arboreum]|uniref:Uncharacterized protein n=1 Tax=Gossypium arboreum TaxID=29729 RepID=A0ABR0MK82_GOSAR|nr:hypothetical protein PVK06_042276 [Gossypium arboreum]